MMELVTGGSGSGKSAYAENAVCQSRRRLQEKEKREIPLYYIADMFPYGRETEEKIENHRRMRAGKGFRGNGIELQPQTLRGIELITVFVVAGSAIALCQIIVLAIFKQSYSTSLCSKVYCQCRRHYDRK